MHSLTLHSAQLLPLTPVEPATFCSHCAREPSGRRHSRICAHCEMGVILEADPRMAPAPGAAFLVCDELLLVCAVSENAERLLGCSEPEAIHRPLSQLLVGADLDFQGIPRLPELLGEAARGDLDVTETVVAPLDAPHDHLRCRVGSCGSPVAALLVLDATPA